MGYRGPWPGFEFRSAKAKINFFVSLLQFQIIYLDAPLDHHYIVSKSKDARVLILISD